MRLYKTDELLPLRSAYFRAFKSPLTAGPPGSVFFGKDNFAASPAKFSGVSIAGLLERAS
jgi:hypothetical protein